MITTDHLARKHGNVIVQPQEIGCNSGPAGSRIHRFSCMSLQQKLSAHEYAAFCKMSQGNWWKKGMSDRCTGTYVSKDDDKAAKIIAKFQEHACCCQCKTPAGEKAPKDFFCCSDPDCPMLSCVPCVKKSQERLRILNVPDWLVGDDLVSLLRILTEFLNCDNYRLDKRLAQKCTLFASFKKSGVPHGLPVGTRCIEFKATVAAPQTNYSTTVRFKVASCASAKEVSELPVQVPLAVSRGELYVAISPGQPESPVSASIADMMNTMMQGPKGSTMMPTRKGMVALLRSMFKARGITNPGDMVRSFTAKSEQVGLDAHSGTLQCPVRMGILVELTQEGVDRFADVIFTPESDNCVRLKGNINIGTCDQHAACEAMPLVFCIQRRRIEDTPLKARSMGKMSDLFGSPVDWLPLRDIIRVSEHSCGDGPSATNWSAGTSAAIHPAGQRTQPHGSDEPQNVSDKSEVPDWDTITRRQSGHEQRTHAVAQEHPAVLTNPAVLTTHTPQQPMPMVPEQPMPMVPVQPMMPTMPRPPIMAMHWLNWFQCMYPWVPMTLFHGLLPQILAQCPDLRVPLVTNGGPQTIMPAIPMQQQMLYMLTAHGMALPPLPFSTGMDTALGTAPTQGTQGTPTMELSQSNDTEFREALMQAYAEKAFEPAAPIDDSDIIILQLQAACMKSQCDAENGRT